MKSRRLQVGDSVRVVAGVTDEDFAVNMEGWQGRIKEILEEKNLILIAWDSVTLQSFADDYISVCEERGLGWEEYYLLPNTVEPTEPRDTKSRTRTTADSLHVKFAWHHLGEEGREISRILAGTDLEDEDEMFGRWKEHLSATLIFPFKAEVTEFQERGPMRDGDILDVVEIKGVENMYGVLVKVKKSRKTYFFPLCDLTPVDEKSSNYQPVRNYAIWFDNR